MTKFSGINRFHPELQALVQRYFVGEISWPDYRRQRHDLIDNIVASQLDTIDFLLPSSHDNEHHHNDDHGTDDDLDDIESEISNTQPYDSETGQFKWNGKQSQPESYYPDSERSRTGIDKWFVVAIIIVVVYLGYSLLAKSDGPLTSSETNADIIDPINNNNHPKELINRFSQMSKWSDTEIDMFIQRWQQFPVVQREDAKSAPWFYEFNLQIKKRYEKYKLQAQSGSSDAARMQLILLQLANAINT